MNRDTMQLNNDVTTFRKGNFYVFIPLVWFRRHWKNDLVPYSYTAEIFCPCLVHYKRHESKTDGDILEYPRIGSLTLSLLRNLVFFRYLFIKEINKKYFFMRKCPKIAVEIIVLDSPVNRAITILIDF